MRLAMQEVVNADAFKDGHLEVVFSRGTTLRVPTDESFEAWEFVGPDGLRTVSLPGGDLGVWRSGDDAAKT